VWITEITDEGFVCAKGGCPQHILTRPTGWHRGAEQRIAACYLAICAAMHLVNHHAREWVPDFQLSSPSEEPAFREPPAYTEYLTSCFF
jgi:hypothetical protein